METLGAITVPTTPYGRVTTRKVIAIETISLRMGSVWMMVTASANGSAPSPSHSRNARIRRIPSVRGGCSPEDSGLFGRASFHSVGSGSRFIAHASSRCIQWSSLLEWTGGRCLSPKAHEERVRVHRLPSELQSMVVNNAHLWRAPELVNLPPSARESAKGPPRSSRGAFELGAAFGIRTRDPFITSEVLWPTELRRRVVQQERVYRRPGASRSPAIS
jgi:hypothetical protein